MGRFGIKQKNCYGISVTKLREIAKEIKNDHGLAQKLWGTGIREAKILATIIDEAEKVTEKQMEDWVKNFDSWDICDECLANLFVKTKFACKKALEWSKRNEEFVKRAGFVLMAGLAMHDKITKDKDFEEFFEIIKKEATDERNFVKKAVNWALRQIGKRNKNLNKRAIEVAKEVQSTPWQTKTSQWIAGDAIRELTSKKF